MLGAMRPVILAVCVLACGGAPAAKPAATGNSTAVTVPTTHRLPQRTADVRIVVSAKEISFNGVPISGQPKVADIKAIFGEPDRTWESGGVNRVHTWDKLGLLIYEPYDASGSNGDGRCVSVTFPFKAMSPSFTPATMFGGTINLDGAWLGPTLGLSTVARLPGATQPYTKQSVVFDRDEFHVFTIEETSGRNLDLVEFSFWQKRTPERPKPAPVLADILDGDNCKDGDVTRCTNRALGHQTGTTGSRNFERVFELVRISCAGGDVFGCVMVGNMYDAGKGTPANKTEARTAWKRACTLGYKPACELLK